LSKEEGVGKVIQLQSKCEARVSKVDKTHRGGHQKQDEGGARWGVTKGKLLGEGIPCLKVKKTRIAALGISKLTKKGRTGIWTDCSCRNSKACGGESWSL